MRSALVLGLVLIGLVGSRVAGADPAADPPLYGAEIRLGYGVTLANGAGMTAPRTAPLTIEGLAAYAINEEPSVFAYGGFLVETLNRSSIGGVAGLQTQQGAVRLRLGGTYIIAPYTLVGMAASAGTCKQLKSARRLCGDLEVTEYFGGTDLVMGHAATQVQLVLGMVFDGP